ADIEACGVVGMNYDPRVDLAEIRRGIRAWTLRRGSGLRIRFLEPGSEANREQSCTPEKAPAIRHQKILDVLGNSVGDPHANTSFLEAGASASAFAARFTAVCTR